MIGKKVEVSLFLDFYFSANKMANIINNIYSKPDFAKMFTSKEQITSEVGFVDWAFDFEESKAKIKCFTSYFLIGFIEMIAALLK